MHKRILTSLTMMSLLTGCAVKPHFDITRAIGLFPPQIENRSDFNDAAKTRCQQIKTDAEPPPQCVRYWEAMLWAQDYRSYVRARAILNRDIIYLGGVVALASVGALAGFSALGHTSSDAYVIIPIVGTFLSGLLAYSKNEALYEAYEVAGMKIDQTLRQAESKVGAQGTPDYDGATDIIRREVGATIDELTRKRIEIVKFQSKSEAEQFKEIQADATERDLASFSLTDAKSDKNPNPTTIIATLNSPPDPQKLSASEMRLRLTDTSNGSVTTLHLSSLDGVTLNAEIPEELAQPGERAFLVEAQARHGSYTLRGAKSLPLSFRIVRFDVEVLGGGSVTYKDWRGKPITCSKENACPTRWILSGQPTQLTATPPAGKTVSWDQPPCLTSNGSTCTVTPSADMKVTANMQQ